MCSGGGKDQPASSGAHMAAVATAAGFTQVFSWPGRGVMLQPRVRKDGDDLHGKSSVWRISVSA